MLAMLTAAFVACKDDDKNDDSKDENSLQIPESVSLADSTVDLGLPSGTKWSKINIGATNPWDKGNYYAWGEVETKSDYSWGTYKHCNDSYRSLTKYCYDASFGTADNKTTLEVTDNVATVVFGTDYTMPTITDWNELSRQCYWVWTDNYYKQNVSGYIVYRAKSSRDKGVKVYKDNTSSPSYSLFDAHIFLPATGSREGSNLYNVQSGHYWSSNLDEANPRNAQYCFFTTGYAKPVSSNYRFKGFSVRPVRRTN